MATFKYTLWKYKGNRGMYPVYLRITANRKNKYISTRLFLNPKHWNERTQTVRATHPQSNELNEQLREFKQTIELKYIKETDAVTVKNKILGKDETHSFVEFANYLIERSELRGQYWNAKQFRVALNKLKEFNDTGEIYFSDIDLKYLQRFEDALRTKGNKQNTIHKNMKMIRRVFTRAVEDGIITTDTNPFPRYKIRSEKVKKQKLSQDELETLEQFETREHLQEHDVKHLFLFALYCGGIRWGDAVTLQNKNIQDGRLIYSMNKTKAPVNIAIPAKARAILSKYHNPRHPEGVLFPFLKDDDLNLDPVGLRRRISSRNAYVNKILNRIRKRAGIHTHISFHIARHTFASIAFERGVPTDTLRVILRHSSYEETEGYLRELGYEIADDAITNVWE